MSIPFGIRVGDWAIELNRRLTLEPDSLDNPTVLETIILINRSYHLEFGGLGSGQCRLKYGTGYGGRGSSFRGEDNFGRPFLSFSPKRTVKLNAIALVTIQERYPLAIEECLAYFKEEFPGTWREAIQKIEVLQHYFQTSGIEVLSKKDGSQGATAMDNTFFGKSDFLVSKNKVFS